MQKNDRLNLSITGLSSEGKGIAHHEGMVVFVAGALPGEKIIAHIILVKKNFAVGRLIEVLEASQSRASAPCAVYGKCGGCNIMHMSYEAQLEFKRNKVSDALVKIGRLTDAKIEAAVASPLNLRYRNKLSMPVRDVGGRVAAGFFAEGSHRLIECTDCLLQSGAAAKIAKLLLQFMSDHKVSAYDEASGNGLVRHLVVREVCGAAIITVVINGVKLPHLEALNNMFQKELSDNYSFYLNLYTKNDNVIAGGKYVFCGGKKEVVCNIGGLKATVNPASFFQVNDGVCALAYDAVEREIRELSPDLIIDAYCGAGLLSCRLAKSAKELVGIEIVPEAIADAVRCAALNNITNTEFFVGDCGELLPSLLQKAPDNTVLFLDPPRKGCDLAVTDAILAAPPAHIVYLSCDPATLARDIERLSPVYKLTRCRPYDMFPQTDNIETLVVLSKTN